MKNETIYFRNFLLNLQERVGYNQPILLKETAHEQPTSANIDQLHIEFTITSLLKDVQGIRPVYAKEGTESKPTLVMEYIPGDSLAEVIQAGLLDITEKLDIAVNIATILSSIHKKQVMHKDLILLDINMPQMNGWQFLEAFRKLEMAHKDEIVIVMLTTSINPEDRAKAGTLSEIGGFRNKPLTKDIIIGVLQEYFTGR